MSSSTESLVSAIRAWRRAIGAEHVRVDSASLAAAEAATFATTQQVPVVLRPADREQVQRCVRIAARHAVALYPTSRGKNWGYGSRVPLASGSALLELERLDRIVEFDERLAYVVIEPGVTFEQLHAFLRRRRSHLYVNSTGSTPASSPLANALERGLGRGPYADRFSATCALEVVLADGSCIRTGFGQFAGARTEHLHRSGVGPSLDGLFSQSSLGVVTRMTLWLSPRAAFTQTLLADVGPGRELGDLVDSLRHLYLRGTMRGPTKILNEYRRLAGVTQFPWKLAGGKAPLERAPARLLAEALEIPPWTVAHSMEQPTLALQRAHQRELRRNLASRVRKLRFVGRAADESGGGTEVDARSVYWRKRTAAPARPAPEEDRCGVVFTAPVVPLVGTEVRRAVRLVENETLAAGFEPMLGFTVMDPRTAYLVSPLFYDRDVAGEDGRAMRCAKRLRQRLESAGYLSYRLGIHSHDALASMDPSNRHFHARLKHALDPLGILAPGRYGSPAQADERKTSR